MISEISKIIDAPGKPLDDKVPDFSAESLKDDRSNIDDKVPDFSAESSGETRVETLNLSADDVSRERHSASDDKVPDFSGERLKEVNDDSLDNEGTRTKDGVPNNQVDASVDSIPEGSGAVPLIESMTDCDDNGIVFKTDGTLLPNRTFEVNGYTYVTDDFGRVVSVSGNLNLPDSNGRLPLNEKNVGGEDKKDTDDRGHLIGDRFGGSNKIENLVAMDSNLNRGDYKRIENTWADALQQGMDVRVDVSIKYDGESKRPSSFTIVSIIDGEKTIAVFKNESSKGVNV